MRKLYPFFVPLATLVLWFVFSGILPSYVLPQPADTFDQLVQGIENGRLISATGNTLTSALFGCVIAALIGIPAGYLLARHDILATMFGPVLAASQAIPAVALAPLLVIWLGYGTIPITILCTIIVIFPIIVTTALGYKGLDPDIIDAARLDGADGWQLISRIETPLAAPAILAGLRTGFTLSITGAVVGEMVMGGSGLGALLAASQGSTANVALLFAVIIVLAFLAISLYLLLTWAERHLDPGRISHEENRPSHQLRPDRSRGLFGWIK